MGTDGAIAGRYAERGLERLDFFARVRPLVESGQWRLTPGGRIAAVPRVDLDDPWVRLRRCPVRRCRRHFEVLFCRFGVVPRFCFDCYKVVVRPRTLVELFRLLETLRRLPAEVPAKCGVELRRYVAAPYGGYAYALGEAEAAERLRLVRALVDEGVSPDVPVALRRGCSEFEQAHPPPAAWTYRPEWGLVERWADAHFVWPPPEPPQPEMLRAGIMRSWIRRALALGDETAPAFAGGGPAAGPRSPSLTGDGIDTRDRLCEE